MDVRPSGVPYFCVQSYLKIYSFNFFLIIYLFIFTIPFDFNLNIFKDKSSMPWWILPFDDKMREPGLCWIFQARFFCHLALEIYLEILIKFELNYILQ